MKRALFLLLALSLGLNGGLLYVRLADRPAGRPARPGPPPRQEEQHAPDPERLIRDHVEGITRHLQLNETQQKAIEAILAESMPELTELLRRSEEANRRVSEAFAAPVFDPAEFFRLTREASLSRARTDSLSAVMLVGESEVLTPEQRQRFAEVAPTIYANPGASRQGPRRGPPAGGPGDRLPPEHRPDR